jgi:hypothetical protein
MVRVKMRKNTNPQYPTCKWVTKYSCNKCGEEYEYYFSSGPICRACNKLIDARPEDLMNYLYARVNWHRNGFTGSIHMGYSYD